MKSSTFVLLSVAVVFAVLTTNVSALPKADGSAAVVVARSLSNTPNEGIVLSKRQDNDNDNDDDDDDDDGNDNDNDNDNANDNDNDYDDRAEDIVDQIQQNPSSVLQRYQTDPAARATVSSLASIPAFTSALGSELRDEFGTQTGNAYFASITQALGATGTQMTGGAQTPTNTANANNGNDNDDDNDEDDNENNNSAATTPGGTNGASSSFSSGLTLVSGAFAVVAAALL